MVQNWVKIYALKLGENMMFKIVLKYMNQDSSAFNILQMPLEKA